MKDKCDDSTSGTAVQLCPDEPAVIAIFMGFNDWFTGVQWGFHRKLPMF